MSLPSNEVAKHQFLTKIMKAIERRPKLIQRLLSDTQEVVVHDTIENKWHRTIALRPEENRLTTIFTHIAKGLYFHEVGKIWSGKVSVLIEFMLSIDEIESNQNQQKLIAKLDSMLANASMKGNNQDVFSYQFAQEDGKSIARLHFYGNSKVTVVFI